MFLLAAVQHASAQDQASAIALATLPLPLTFRDAATVVRLRMGRPDTLRAGTNPMVCFADNPTDSLIDVRCYHTTLVPLIYAARRLGGPSLEDSTLDRRMREEIRAGRLTAPGPTAGYRILGPARGYDPVSNTVGPELDRWQSLHIPFATASTLGLGESERGTDPYLMSGGTWWAHIMIMEQPLRY
jgi:hypothetical protein